MGLCRSPSGGRLGGGVSGRRDPRQRHQQCWGRNDPTGSGQWLATLPEDKGKQNLVQNFANSIAYQYPELAAPWAEALTEETARNSALENVAQQWLRTDSTSARAWIDKTSLPDDVKQRLLKPR